MMTHMHIMETEKIGPNLALDLLWNYFVAFKPEGFGPGPMVSPVIKRLLEITFTLHYPFNSSVK